MSGTSKSLSNSTLSLRFMQNAHRSKQQAEVDAEKAQVRDEAEWEVANSVRDAWGTSSRNDSEGAVTYETSYLPFLFPSLHESLGKDGEASSSTFQPPNKLQGRRSFNKYGVETVSKPDDEPIAQPQITEEYPKGKRPATLSGSSATVYKAHKDDRKAKDGRARSPPRPVPVLKMISEDAAVGVDLRTARKARTAVGARFMRPAGVDSPAVGGAEAKAVKRERSPAPEGKVKLEADNGVGAAELAPKKKKKSV